MNTTLAILTLIILFIFFCFLFTYFLKRYGIFKNSGKMIYLEFAFLYIGLTGLVIAFLKVTEFVPFWDYSGYWISTVTFTNDFFGNIVDSIKSIYSSLNYDDYTKLPVIFLTPVLKLINGRYKTYILGDYLLYLTPFYFIFCIFINKLAKKNNCNSFIPTLLILFFPPLLSPVLRGYIDVMGLSFIAVFMLITLNENFSDKFHLTNNILIAVLTLVFLFVRRWYLFYAVTFFIVLFLITAIELIIQKKYKNILNVIYNFACIGVIIFAVLMLLFRPYVIHVLSNDFSNVYSAYKFGNLTENILAFLRYYGYFIIGIAVLGMVLAIKDNRYRKFSVFLISQMILIFFMFTRIQSMGYHHYYLVNATVLFFVLMSVILAKGKFRVVMQFLVVAVFALNVIQSYIPNNITLLNDLGDCLTDREFYPFVRTDLNTFNELRDYLKEISSPEDEIYILSSSEVFNDDMIRNMEMPDELTSLPNLAWTSHVDKRDGLSDYLFTAKYFVIADPVQTHLDPNDQQVVDYFARHYLFDKNLTNLKEIKVFTIENDVKLHVLERTAPFPDDFLKSTQEYFDDKYPALLNMFQVPSN